MSENLIMEPKAIHKLSYGLYVLTAKEGDKDNGCIINTASQITESPKRITIAVNKANYTHDMIKNTGIFNVSVLDESAPFKVFEKFGFSSGRDHDKFADCKHTARTANGLRYVPNHTNAVLSGRVINALDYGSHTLFVADLEEARVLSDNASMTYAYYFEHVKPKPEAPKKRGFVCKICGYVYEGDTLPDDFICPICKHGVEDFEPIG